MVKLIFFSLFFTSFAFADIHEGAISTATAGTGRASVDPSESPFLNPATMAFLRGYFFTSGISGATQADSSNSQDVAISITDSLPDTIVPTSINYVQSGTEDSNKQTWDSKIFGLSFGGMVYKRFAFGLSGHQRQDQFQLQSYQQNNLSMGVVFAPTETLGFAVVSDNFLGAPTNIPEVFKLNPTTTFAMNYNYRSFVRWKVDVSTGSNNSFAKPTIAGGVESFMNRWIVIRAGIAKNAEKDANIYAGGIGFSGPKFGIHYGYLSSPEDQSLTRHSVDLAIPVW